MNKQPKKAAKKAAKKAPAYSIEVQREAPASGWSESVAGWKWTPSAAQQLQAKVEALFDIAELAEQIRDPEVFRRHALKIARREAAISATISVEVG